MNVNLLYNSEVKRSTGTGLVSLTTIYSDPVDMSDAVGCLFLYVGSSDMTAKTTAHIHLQASTYSSGGFANYGTTVAVASTLGGKQFGILGVDCYKPSFRFMRVGVHGATGQGSFVAIKYGMRKAGSTELRDDANAGIALAINITSS